MAPEDYLHGVLAGGARPFRYRGLVRTLLGMPDDSGVHVAFAPAPPRPGFTYVRQQCGTAGPGETPGSVPQWWEHAEAGIFESEIPITAWESDLRPGTGPVGGPAAGVPPHGVASNSGPMNGSPAADDARGSAMSDVAPAGVPAGSTGAGQAADVVVPGIPVRPTRENLDQGHPGPAARPPGSDDLKPPAAASAGGSWHADGGGGERSAPGTPYPGEQPGRIRQVPSVRPDRAAGTPTGQAGSMAIEPATNRPLRVSEPRSAGPGAQGSWAKPDNGETVAEPDGPRRGPAPRPVLGGKVTDTAPRVAELPYRTSAAQPPAAPVAPPVQAPVSSAAAPSVIVVKAAAPKAGADAFWERRHLGRLRSGLLR